MEINTYDDPGRAASRLQLPAHSGDRLARDDPGRDEIASEVHRLYTRPNMRRMQYGVCGREREGRAV